MKQEYPTSLGSMFFYGAGAAASIIFSFILYGAVLGSAVRRDYYSNQYNDTHHYGLLIIPAIGIGIAALIILNLIRRKVTLSSDAVSYRSVWGSKEILTGDIKGFRIGEKAISIIPNDTGHGKILIRDYSSISDNADVRSWLRENFKDLDKSEFEAAKEELLQDAALGATKDEREAAFKKYRTYNMIYSMTAIGTFFIPIWLGIFNVYLALLLFIYPALGMVLIANSKGLIRLFARKNSTYSPIFMGLFFASASLAIQSTISVRIISFDKLWEPAAAIALVVCAMLYYIAVVKSKDSVQNQIVFVLIIGCIYAFGITVMINCSFDNSPVKTYSAKITDKYIHRGKSTSYDLVLGECPGFSGTENMSVSSSHYYSTAIGTAVKIDMRQGTFGAPWFTIEY